MQPYLDRGDADGQRSGRLLDAELFDVAQHQDFPVDRRKLFDRLLKEFSQFPPLQRFGGDLPPVPQERGRNFVQSGYGLGLLPARFIANNHSLDSVEVLRPPSFDLYVCVAIVRAGQLGALERAVGLLEHGIRQLFEEANTGKPVTRSRRGVPANRRKTRPRK